MSGTTQVSGLQAVLAAEHAAIYGYGVLGAHLAGAQQATATSDWVSHQVSRDTLETRLRGLGAQPVPASVAYQLPSPVTNGHQAVALAITLEDRVATAWLALVGAAPQARSFAALGLRGCALRAAAWRGATVAFPGLPARSLLAPRPGP
jgi:hypothetical protein